jgi:hypothetical protein
MQVPVIEDEAVFNTHVRARSAAPLANLLTREHIETHVKDAGLDFEVDTATFDDHSFLWKADVSLSSIPHGNNWWLYVQSLEDKSLRVEMRWCNNIDDTSDQLTFSEVIRMSAFAKRVVKLVFSRLCDAPCILQDDVVFNVHVWTYTPRLAKFPTCQDLEEHASSLGLSFDTDEAKFDNPKTFLWDASDVTLPTKPDVGHWWLHLVGLDDKSVKIEMRWLYNMEDSAGVHGGFQRTKMLYAFATEIVKRMHAELVR